MLQREAVLIEAAAQAWNVPADEIETDKGILSHKNSGKTADYGQMASAASQLKAPEEVELKDLKDFKIIGTSRKNVDGSKIVTGQPLYGLDYKQEGMLIAMVASPPAFGLKLKSYDDSIAKTMPGIKEIFTINTYEDDYNPQWSDITAFTNLVVIVGHTTWEVMNAKKALKTEWEPIEGSTAEMDFFGGKLKVETPSGFENTDAHYKKMAEFAAKPGNTLRKDGDPEKAFKNAARIIERNYTAPFLAHNTMEPMNFFANVTADKAELVGPIQTPEFMEKTVAARLGMPLEKVDIHDDQNGWWIWKKTLRTLPGRGGRHFSENECSDQVDLQP